MEGEDRIKLGIGAAVVGLVVLIVFWVFYSHSAKTSTTIQQDTKSLPQASVTMTPFPTDTKNAGNSAQPTSYQQPATQPVYVAPTWYLYQQQSSSGSSNGNLHQSQTLNGMIQNQ